MLLYRRGARTSSPPATPQPLLDPLLSCKIPALRCTALLWMVLLVGKHLRLHTGRSGAHVPADLRALFDRRVEDVAETRACGVLWGSILRGTATVGIAEGSDG